MVGVVVGATAAPPIAAVAMLRVATELNWITGDPVTTVSLDVWTSFTPWRVGAAVESQTFWNSVIVAIRSSQLAMGR